MTLPTLHNNKDISLVNSSSSHFKQRSRFCNQSLVGIIHVKTKIYISGLKTVVNTKSNTRNLLYNNISFVLRMCSYETISICQRKSKKFTLLLAITKGEKSQKRNKVVTSLASGSLCFTLVNTDQTSLDIFNTRVSGQPATHVVIHS